MVIKKLLGLRFASFLQGALFILLVACTPKADAVTSFLDVLELYGYGHPEDKKALACVMERSGLLTKGQSLEERFPPRSNDQDLIRDVLAFVQQTQEAWVVRKGTQERWEVKPTEWMEESAHDKGLRGALEHLGVVAAMPPSMKEVDAICELGSTLPSIKGRIAYTHHLLKENLKAKNLILLGAQRPVTVGIDGDEKELLKIAEEAGLKDLKELTETHLMQKAYQESPLFKMLDTHIIDTPKGSLPRPTTETTLQELVTWLGKHPDIQKIVFVSSQPNVLYQKAVITQVLEAHGVKLTFDVAGDAASPDTNIQRLVGALGSYFWAQTPMILKMLNVPLKDHCYSPSPRHSRARRE